MTEKNWVDYSPTIMKNWTIVKMTPNMWRSWSVDLCDYINSNKCGPYSVTYSYDLADE